MLVIVSYVLVTLQSETDRKKLGSFFVPFVSLGSLFLAPGTLGCLPLIKVVPGTTSAKLGCGDRVATANGIDKARPIETIDNRRE